MGGVASLHKIKVNYAVQQSLSFGMAMLGNVYLWKELVFQNFFLLELKLGIWWHFCVIFCKLPDSIMAKVIIKLRILFFISIWLKFCRIFSPTFLLNKSDTSCSLSSISETEQVGRMLRWRSPNSGHLILASFQPGKSVPTLWALNLRFRLYHPLLHAKLQIMHQAIMTINVNKDGWMHTMGRNNFFQVQN